MTSNYSTDFGNITLMFRLRSSLHNSRVIPCKNLHSPLGPGAGHALIRIVPRFLCPSNAGIQRAGFFPDRFRLWRKFIQLLGFYTSQKHFRGDQDPVMSEAQRLPNTVNLAFVEGLYLNYLKNPLSVPPEWRAYFDQLSKSDRDNGSPRLCPSFHPPSIFNPPTMSGNGGVCGRESGGGGREERGGGRFR